MIYMHEEDLRTVALHYRRNHYTGEIEPIGFGPFWYMWPDMHFVGFDDAREHQEIPYCPNCYFPLTATGYHPTEDSEYYICRFCESKALGPIFDWMPKEEEHTPEPVKISGPTEAQKRIASQTLEEKYRYLIK